MRITVKIPPSHEAKKTQADGDAFHITPVIYSAKGRQNVLYLEAEDANGRSRTYVLQQSARDATLKLEELVPTTPECDTRGTN